MRKTSPIVTGLDIGSSKVSAVMAELAGEGGISVIAAAGSPSRGIERGGVIDLAEAANSVSKALERLSEKADVKPDNLYVNISGRGVRTQESKGIVPLSSRGREITAGDIARCVNVASTMKLPLDRDIIHKIMHSFYLDDETEVKDPLGLYACRLSVNIYAVTAGTNHIQNLMKCVNIAGYEVKEFVLSAIADSFALFSPEDRKKNVLLADIGDSISDIAVFLEGNLHFIDILPLGSRDIAATGGEDGALTKICSSVKEAAEKFRKDGKPVKEVVLAGGFSVSDRVSEAEDRLGLPVRIGSARGIKGNISSSDSIPAVTAIGLAKYGLEEYKSRLGAKEGSPIKQLASKVVDLFNSYF